MDTSEVQFMQSESLSLERTASGKYTYKIKCLGKPEDLKERIKQLKQELDTVISE